MNKGIQISCLAQSFCSTVINENSSIIPRKKVKKFGIIFPEKKFDKVPEVPVNVNRIQITPFRSHNTTSKNSKNLHTQIEMRFEVEKATWIPIEVRSVLYERTKHKLNKKGELIIAAFKYKTRQANYRDALNRIKQLIEDARNVAMGQLTVKDQRAYIIHRNRHRRARRRIKKVKEATLIQSQFTNNNTNNNINNFNDLNNYKILSNNLVEIQILNSQDNMEIIEERKHVENIMIFEKEEVQYHDYDYDDDNFKDIFEKRNIILKNNVNINE